MQHPHAVPCAQTHHHCYQVNGTEFASATDYVDSWTTTDVQLQ